MTKTQQALLSFAIRALAVGAVAVLDFVSQALSNGSIQLPAPTITIPLVGMIVAEADTWLVNWNKQQN